MKQKIDKLANFNFKQKQNEIIIIWNNWFTLNLNKKN